jgi:hypothetical protein
MFQRNLNPKLFKDLDKGKIYKILTNVKNSSNWRGGGSLRIIWPLTKTLKKQSKKIT